MPIYWYWDSCRSTRNELDPAHRASGLFAEFLNRPGLSDDAFEGFGVSGERASAGWGDANQVRGRLPTLSGFMRYPRRAGA